MSTPTPTPSSLTSRPSQQPGRLLLTLVAVATSYLPFWADFNETHIYNPLWLPHAKFHTGQTMSMGFALGALTLYHLWRGKPAYDLDSAFTAYLLASAYWATQIAAWFYPNVQAVDPPAGKWEFPQIAPSSVFLGLSALGYWLERRRFGGWEKGKGGGKAE